MKRMLALVTASMVLTAGLAAAQSRASFDRTLAVSGAVQLEVSSGSGSVTVRTGADDAVEIHGRVRARSSREDVVREIAANPPIRQDGNIIRVGPLDDDLRRGVSVSYEIVVPVATQLETNTGSGSQTIEDIAGPLDATTGSGSLEIGRIGASVDARTGSGSITIAGVDGDLDVTAGSGSIRAEDVSGAIERDFRKWLGCGSSKAARATSPSKQAPGGFSLRASAVRFGSIPAVAASTSTAK